jgi:hypothetical protein
MLRHELQNVVVRNTGPHWPTEPARRICDSLSPHQVREFFWWWFLRLPGPLTQADVRAGYGYEWAFRQFEISETCMFDRP